MRLHRLIRRSSSVQEVLRDVLAFPKWYLETEEQKRLNKKLLEDLYNKVKGQK